ncbi:MAG: hypothetical protein K0R38_7248 [Polyangiaceae bacterium]|jgi:hypothetical protein|nr:hypothetical protein [Polyangiaceae bacterium]
MSDIDAALRDAVEGFVLQLKELFQRSALETVQDAFGAGGTSKGRGGRAARSAAPARGRASRKGAKRSPEALEELVQRLHAYIKKNPGERIEQIGAALGAGTKELALPAKKLIADKKLSTKGQKRATTYFAK